MRALLLIALVSALPCMTNAEERFYQIMGADGRMQVIREPVPDKSSVDASASPLQPSSASSDIKGQAMEPTPQNQSKKLIEVYAPYDGEDYVDSDAMDAVHEGADNGAKKHFYVIPDGIGQRVEGMSDEVPQAFVPDDALPAQRYVDLKQATTSRDISQIQGLESGCLLAADKENAKILQVGKLGDVVFDRRLANYVRPGEVVQLYRLEKPGLGSATIKSYAMKDNEPAFALPLLAFADKNGCVSRIDDAYFQRFYPADRYKRAMLEARLLVHVDDAFVLVIMPDGSEDRAENGLEYRVSSIGRVSLKWQY
jgi:hypothetical protein